ncbi:uncharacterized protein GIQ15_04203 [Arthroderma uncinatum]|uniref:uncharacterized protein n=1 Tax=Arthroderma uncinatum TaxID=74035 RepID=UPI00144A630F|nr:uncharacterized protein GIQ15_04203 [Arthroderma uncinatum]KAF3481444.1 hypothetical protein GIQ15_04203 [Arthroderma uncinatum]
MDEGIIVVADPWTAEDEGKEKTRRLELTSRSTSTSLLDIKIHNINFNIDNIETVEPTMFGCVLLRLLKPWIGPAETMRYPEQPLPLAMRIRSVLMAVLDSRLLVDKEPLLLCAFISFIAVTLSGAAADSTMNYGQPSPPYSTPQRLQGGGHFNPGYGQPLFFPRSWHGPPRGGWGRTPPRYHRYNRLYNRPQTFSQPVPPYPNPPRLPYYNWQSGNWARWKETPSPTLCSSPFRNRASKGNSLSAPQGRVSRMVSDDTQENAFSEIMNGEFDLKKSPLSLGRKLANVNTNSAANWLLNQPNPFGTPTQPGKRAASSQLTPPPETYKKSNSSSSGQSNYPPGPSKDETITVGLGYRQDARNQVSWELSHLAQLIQQNTEQSTELGQILSMYLNQRRQEIGSQRGTDRGSDQNPERPEDGDGMLSPGPHVANGGGDSPDPPHDDKNTFRGHMIDCVEMNSEPNSGSSSDAGTGSTKATSIRPEPLEPEEKALISALDTLRCPSSHTNSADPEDDEKRCNRFERIPERGGLSRRAPSPNGSPPGKQIEFDFVSTDVPEISINKESI